MTTQEYIQKEAEKQYGSTVGFRTEGFQQGLSVGIKRAKEFHKWSDDNGWERYEVGGDTWYKFNGTEDIKTTSELFEIFLTERNEK